jgi:hypothetical protein
MMIFYLPLAFCAALWSINNNYSTSAFAITAVFVAITTYLLVANLENAVSTLKSLYHLVKRPVIGRMKKDGDEEWAVKGQSFDGFRPDRKNVEPSEWNVVEFLTVKVLRKLRILSEHSAASDQQDPEDTV